MCMRKTESGTNSVIKQPSRAEWWNLEWNEWNLINAVGWLSFEPLFHDQHALQPYCRALQRGARKTFFPLVHKCATWVRGNKFKLALAILLSNYTQHIE